MLMKFLTAVNEFFKVKKLKIGLNFCTVLSDKVTGIDYNYERIIVENK